MAFMNPSEFRDLLSEYGSSERMVAYAFEQQTEEPVKVRAVAQRDALLCKVLDTYRRGLRAVP